MHANILPNPFDFSNQVVLVTGSGKGLGRAIALRFAQAGAQVAVHYHSSPDGAREVVAAIQAMGGKADLFQADVTQPASVAALFAWVEAQFGRLDVLINNAGSYPTTPLLEMSAEEWDLVIDSNLKSVHLCTQAAAQAMISRGRAGSILNIASIEGQMTAPGHSHYNAAKAGVIMYTRSAARELARHAIRVNAVSPGLIWRPGIEESIPAYVDDWKKANPSGRMGQPEEIGDACLFLASSAAAWITGINLPVDGGALTH